MDAKQLYTEVDCTETGYACSIKAKVVVLNCEVLQQNCRNQSFYCLCGNGVDANPKGCAVFLVSLSNGEFSLKRRNWEDDEESFENYCPDCGCGMTFENDGGNGFCIKCAPEH